MHLFIVGACCPPLTDTMMKWSHVFKTICIRMIFCQLIVHIPTNIFCCVDSFVDMQIRHLKHAHIYIDMNNTIVPLGDV